MPVAFLRWSRSRPLCNGGSGGVSCLVASPASRPSSLSEPHQVVGQYLRQLLAIAYRGGLKGGLLSACVGRPKSARLRPSARARLTRGVVQLGTAGKEAAWTSLVKPSPSLPRPTAAAASTPRQLCAAAPADAATARVHSTSGLPPAIPSAPPHPSPSVCRAAPEPLPRSDRHVFCSAATAVVALLVPPTGAVVCRSPPRKCPHGAVWGVN